MKKKLESQVVRHLMPDANEQELEEATRRWFNFLRILLEIVIERERDRHDSRESGHGDRFEKQGI